MLFCYPSCFVPTVHECFIIFQHLAGAYPEQTTVYAQVSQLFVALSWYIYSANSDTDINTYYGEQLLTPN